MVSLSFAQLRDSITPQFQEKYHNPCNSAGNLENKTNKKSPTTKKNKFRYYQVRLSTFISYAQQDKYSVEK